VENGVCVCLRVYVEFVSAFKYAPRRIASVESIMYEIANFSPIHHSHSVQSRDPSPSNYLNLPGTGKEARHQNIIDGEGSGHCSSEGSLAAQMNISKAYTDAGVFSVCSLGRGFAEDKCVYRRGGEVDSELDK
jgi:hypothetical protein